MIKKLGEDYFEVGNEWFENDKAHAMFANESEYMIDLLIKKVNELTDIVNNR